MRHVEHTLEDRQRATTGVSRHDTAVIERRLADPEERAHDVDGDRGHRDGHLARAQRICDSTNLFPRVRQGDVCPLEEIGSVRRDLRGGVDGEGPSATLPHVARAASSDARDLIVVVERGERPTRNGLSDRRMVEHDQVVPLEFLDRLVGERLQRPCFPRDLDVGSNGSIRVGRRPEAAISAHVIPGDAPELDHHAEPIGTGAPSIPTSNRVRCQRPRFDVNIVVPRNARLVGCARVWALRS